MVTQSKFGDLPPSYRVIGVDSNYLSYSLEHFPLDINGSWPVKFEFAVIAERRYKKTFAIICLRKLVLRCDVGSTDIGIRGIFVCCSESELEYLFVLLYSQVIYLNNTC